MSQTHPNNASRDDQSELDTYRELLAQQTELMVQTDVHGNFTYVSDSYCQLFGKTREDLLGQSFMPLVHPDDQAVTDQAMQALWAPPYRCYLEQRALTRHGWRWLAWRDRTILDSQGKPTAIIGTAIDITERKQALAALQDSEELYRQLFMNMQEAFCLQETIVDQDGIPCDNRLLAVNPAFETLMGMSARDLEGRRIKELFPEIEDFWVSTFGQVALTGQAASVEHFSAVRNRYYRVSAYSPRLGQFAAFVSDVTQAVQQAEAQRLLDQRIQKTQKLEALSLLAAGAAHDFNNVLMAIAGHADLAQSQLMQGDRQQASMHMNEVHSAAQRARELCQHMMSFAGSPSQTTQTAIDVHALISEITRFLSSIVKPRAEVHLDLDDQLAPVHGDPGALRQVMMNLITNACEAIEETPGRIIISLHPLSDTATLPQETMLTADLRSSPHVVIQVCDNGQGMEEDTQRRIFEPFFTTKEDGKGLGLAATLGIIKAMRGDIHIASTPGSGTVISLFLPTETQPHGSRRDHLSATRDQSLHGHVLFADDDDLLRELGKNMLESMGLWVSTCADGLEVLEQWRAHPEGIDAVIVDISMPGMGGLACAQALRNQGYRKGIIFSTGYDQHASDIAGSHLHDDILVKPYSMDTMRDIMSRILTTQ